MEKSLFHSITVSHWFLETHRLWWNEFERSILWCVSGPVPIVSRCVCTLTYPQHSVSCALCLVPGPAGPFSTATLLICRYLHPCRLEVTCLPARHDFRCRLESSSPDTLPLSISAACTLALSHHKPYRSQPMPRGTTRDRPERQRPRPEAWDRGTPIRPRLGSEGDSRRIAVRASAPSQ